MGSTRDKRGVCWGTWVGVSVGNIAPCSHIRGYVGNVSKRMGNCR